MSALRQGHYSQPHAGRPPVDITIFQDRSIRIGPKPVSSSHAFQVFAGAPDSNRVLAERLFSGVQRMSESPDADDAAIAAALAVSDPDWLDTLHEHGLTIRELLRDSDFDRELERRGVFGDDPPEVTITEEGEHPIHWELFCEDTGGEPQWEDFWGFRLPIAHWIPCYSPELVRMSRIFSAVDEGMRYASREANMLSERYPQLGCQTLVKELRVRVEAAIAKRLGDDEQQIGEWWAAHGDARWLKRFVAGHEGPAHAWKREALIEILAAGIVDGVVHFACHCAPGSTAVMSELEIEIAGEPLLLNAAALARLGTRGTPYPSSGPLVFINACESASPSAFSPAAFPSMWVTKGGATAVIGTLCPVPDYFAHAFAAKFYEFLKSEIDASQYQTASLARVLLATRRHFLDRYGNPLGLAYVLYSAERTRVVVDY